MNKRNISRDEKIGAFWDRQREKARYSSRIRWWQSEAIIRHCNFNICGSELAGWNAGPIALLRRESKGRVLKKAISVGCGSAVKEMQLIEEGIVEGFVCYELSKTAVQTGEEIAASKGLSEKVHFHYGDFFQSDDNQEETYDLVFWDNSMHHMLDTRAAVQNSKRILKQGGYFFCNDYIGENRFQWTDLELLILNGIRQSLPDEIYEISGGGRIRRNIWRPDLQTMIENDFSEAADSENIIPAVLETFENPLIQYTGGYVYHTCLNDILQNIPEDSSLLKQLLALDDELTEHGFSQYAFILAEK